MSLHYNLKATGMFRCSGSCTLKTGSSWLGEMGVILRLCVNTVRLSGQNQGTIKLPSFLYNQLKTINFSLFNRLIITLIFIEVECHTRCSFYLCLKTKNLHDRLQITFNLYHFQWQMSRVLSGIEWFGKFGLFVEQWIKYEARCIVIIF